MNKLFKTHPAVFAVDDTYQIMVPVNEPALMWVDVEGEKYFDHSNGIVRSEVDIHRMTVPADKLEKAGEYTVCWRKIIERKPYYSETHEMKSETYKFRPVPAENAVCYHISDAHGSIDLPVKAAETFEKEYGKIDFLILNGDITSQNDKPEDFDNIYEIASKLTGGEIPVVFSRGNHDMRGLLAEKFEYYTPHSNGKTYYTFKLGSIWGVLLDCGEDKPDSSDEYGHTICCHPFRREQTEYIKKLAEKDLKDVKHRVVVSHIPFTFTKKEKFDIERELYAEWANLLKNTVKPGVMICGHEHGLEISAPGSEKDSLGHPCTVVVGGDLKSQPPTYEIIYYAGAGLVFGKNGITVVFTDSNGKILEKAEITE